MQPKILTAVKKIMNAIVPFLYLIPVFLVVLHQTDYDPIRALTPPYLFYILIAGVVFTLLRNILKESNEESNED